MGKTMREKHDDMMRDPEYAAEYEVLEEEFVLAQKMIEDRIQEDRVSKQTKKTAQGPKQA